MLSVSKLRSSECFRRFIGEVSVNDDRFNCPKSIGKERLVILYVVRALYRFPRIRDFNLARDYFSYFYSHDRRNEICIKIFRMSAYYAHFVHLCGFKFSFTRMHKTAQSTNNLA